MPDLAHRLRKAREAKDWSQSDLARAVGVRPQTIQQIEAGDIKKPRSILEIAKALGVDAEYLASGRGNNVAPVNSRQVTVKADVQAGAWSESFEWADPDQYFDVVVPDVAWLRGMPVYAAIARGTSMNRRYPDGTVLVFVEFAARGEELIEGKRYHVERTDAAGQVESTVKTLRQDDKGRWWAWPESDDPEYQAPLAINGNHGETITIKGRVVYALLEE